ncbi:MAG: CDP-glycerol glycerophosphotransferase family protein [Propionibacteriaceae bacterium]|jgi:CDP-glycerol glycerophosphotransferase|nr:CDP-glycerol glycerophosphotransferase family protein [Propionibacteriaceae bacterium]
MSPLSPKQWWLVRQARAGKPDWDRLKTEVFPTHPDVFTELFRAAGRGVPKAYKRAAQAPVNEQAVFFESNLGKQYTGNPRYIYERMLQTHPDWTYFWSYNGDPSVIPGNPIVFPRSSEAYATHAAEARYLVNNTVLRMWFHRPESFYLQTWHGTPYKLMHWDRTLNPIERRSSPDFWVKSRGWDALLSPNAHSSQVFRTAFRYDGPILDFGYPANDIFYDPDRYAGVRSRLRAQLSIDAGAPVYLYAPTWRDDGHLGGQMYRFDLLLDVDDFLAHAPAGAVLLVRAHHMSAAEGELAALPEGVIDVSHFDDATELMCAADTLITDYSSIVFDWACSRKPVIYWVPDIDHYTNALRGSYFSLDEINAGPVCRTPAELHTALSSTPTPYDTFYERFCSFHDGHSTTRLLEYLLSQ